jgi:hypothetical protein
MSAVRALRSALGLGRRDVEFDSFCKGPDSGRSRNQRPVEET